MSISISGDLNPLVSNSEEISNQNNLLNPINNQRGYLKRFGDFTLATFRDLGSRWNRRNNPLVKQARQLFPSLEKTDAGYAYPEQNSWSSGESLKLVVLIHGLNSSPLSWTRYFKDFPLDNPETSCFAPYVHEKGYCSLSDAADPILNVVQSYATQYPNNPIYLVGHSNGARIAAYVEQKLNAKNIKLISIAGPHGGTKLVNWVHKLGLSKCFGFSSNMVEELKFGGKWATNFLVQWKNNHETYKQTGKVVERVFMASASDWRVAPIETSFPHLPNSKFELISGQSHVTIIDSVKERVIQIIGEKDRL